MNEVVVGLVKNIDAGSLKVGIVYLYIRVTCYISIATRSFTIFRVFAGETMNTTKLFQHLVINPSLWWHRSVGMPATLPPTCFLTLISRWG